MIVMAEGARQEDSGRQARREGCIERRPLATSGLAFPEFRSLPENAAARAAKRNRIGGFVDRSDTFPEKDDFLGRSPSVVRCSPLARHGGEWPVTRVCYFSVCLTGRHDANPHNLILRVSERPWR